MKLKMRSSYLRKQNAEQETEHDVIELNEDCDVMEESEEENEPEHHVTSPDLVKDRDVIAEESETDCDVIAEENKTDHDVIEESDEDSVVAMFTVPYESSDFSSDEEIPPDYLAEIPPLLNEEDENMNFDWKGILSNLKTYYTFSTLKQYISRTTLPEVRPIIKYLVEENDVVDSIAAKFFPRDGPKGYIPIETMGDGNCSYRALTHVLLSNEGRYQEVQARITFEFLTHDILARGDLEGSENRPAAYASYSGFLTPEITRLNKQSIRTVYHCDVIANARDFTFMGMWQIHHAAEAFRHPIVSVYPWHTNKEIRKDINRVVLPINPMHDIK